MVRYATPCDPVMARGEFADQLADWPGPESSPGALGLKKRKEIHRAPAGPLITRRAIVDLGPARD
jgi:hypothetical protein